MERSTQFDALIIGGGPGGSTAANLLAHAGKKVLLLEKERFPRFHIGESLLPYNQPIFEELGVLPAFEKAGFVHKYGAQFYVGDGSKTLQLVFKNGRFTREPLAFQVERATFDHILLKQAAASGADVREGWTVTATGCTEREATLTATGPGGQTEIFHGAFLIDASGRANLTANQEGIRTIHPRLKKLAIFGHFAGVQMDAGSRGGDTIIVRLKDKWFWLIPLSADKVSVGCVMDQAAFANANETPSAIFERVWRESPPLRQRLQHAHVLGAIHTTSDFSYRNRRLVGPRLMRVGDAAGFMDPIFSAGVYLAMHSGKLAARVVLESLAAQNDGHQLLQQYEKTVNRSMKLYWNLVEGFYDQPFFEVFMEPRHGLDLPAAVTAILGGELEGGWALWWRMRLFFLITRIQRYWPLLPRITFRENPGKTKPRMVRAT